MTPTDVVSSFERHMKVEVRLGLSTMVASAEKVMPTLLTRLRSLNPSMDEVTAVLEHLGRDDCLFTNEQRQEIGVVAQATMVDPTAVVTRTVVKTQQHLHLHYYLPARLWACLESGDRKENKFRQLAQFMCQSLGLRNPDVKTKRCSLAFQKYNP